MLLLQEEGTDRSSDMAERRAAFFVGVNTDVASGLGRTANRTCIVILKTVATYLCNRFN
jgi:hypothetical protein